VFTARYELVSYIKQITFRPKKLNNCNTAPYFLSSQELYYLHSGKFSGLPIIPQSLDILETFVFFVLSLFGRP
jgi:hypothetical protein